MLRRKYKTLNNITISSTALLKNYHHFQSINPYSLIAPVLKSNAYGHGLNLIAKFVDQQIKPPFICVDSLFEAYQLKHHKIKTPILIMGYTFPQNYKTTKKLPFSFPTYDIETLKALSKYQPGAKIHIKIDTGMNRLGLQLPKIPHFIKTLKKIKNLNIEGIYSHLSQADDTKRSVFTTAQVATFKQAINMFHQTGYRFKWRHLCATAGVTATKDKQFNLIRLGLGFYGYSPFSKPHPQTILQPALTLTSHLVQVKRVGEGSQVSYGGTYQIKNPTTIGILPMGYYDGIDRRLSNQGIVTIDGAECPIIGRVCMNLTIIDLSKIPSAKVGSQATIISPHQNAKNSLLNHSSACQTIPYDLLVNLDRSTKRTVI